MADGAKDYVEHLRTTHFSLILTCFVLFAASFIARSGTESALPELREILTALEDTTRTFPEHFLRQRAVVRWVGRIAQHTLETGPSERTLVLPMPPLWYRDADTWMPLRNRLKSPPRTLDEFRKDWDDLHAQPLVRIGATDDRYSSDENGVYNDVDILTNGERGEEWKSSTVTVHPADPRELASLSSENSLVATLLGTRDSGAPSSIEHPDMVPVIELPHSVAETNHVLWIVSDVTPAMAVTLPVTIDTVAPQDDRESRWSSGTFAAAFPALAEAAGPFASIPIGDLESALIAELHAADDDVEVFGAKMPREAIARWGVPVILSLQLYFMLHFRSLVRLFGPQAKLERVPWVGLYDESLARWVTGLSIVGLPAIAIVVLLIRTNFVDGVGSGAIAVAFVLAACQFSWTTALDLRDWWTRPGNA